MTKLHRKGPVPRGFRAGAALAPGSTAIARLYAERVATFDELVDAQGRAPEAEINVIVDDLNALDRRLLATPPTRLADLGAKARILRYYAAGLGDESAPAARRVFEAMVVEFLEGVEICLGSPVDRAAGIGAS